MLSQVRNREYKFRRFLAVHIIDSLDPDKYLCRHVCPEYAAAVHRAALCRAVSYVWLGVQRHRIPPRAVASPHAFLSKISTIYFLHLIETPG